MVEKNSFLSYENYMKIKLKFSVHPQLRYKMLLVTGILVVVLSVAVFVCCVAVSSSEDPIHRARTLYDLALDGELATPGGRECPAVSSWQAGLLLSSSGSSWRSWTGQ